MALEAAGGQNILNWWRSSPVLILAGQQLSFSLEELRLLIEVASVLKKVQIALCVLIGIGIVVFFVAMITNVNVPMLPKWLTPVAWGSFGVMVVGSLGVVVTLALERERKPKPVVEKTAKEEAAEEEAEAGTDAAHEGELESSEVGEVHSAAGESPVESEPVDTGFENLDEHIEAATHSEITTDDADATTQFEPHEAHEGDAAPEIDFEDFK
jgi:hypothetical protein